MTSVALKNQAAQSYRKQLTQCIVGTKMPEYATRILPMCHPKLNFQVCSRWFSRGWTLQLLLAPSEVISFDEEWKSLGTRKNLRPSLSSCTGIPEGILARNDDLRRVSIAQRISWAVKRVRKRLEDRAYCLIDIFGINMPLLYREEERAFLRL